MKLVSAHSWLAAAGLALAACSSSPPLDSATAPVPPWSADAENRTSAPQAYRPGKPATPRIAKGSPGLQCVPYARAQSGIPIHGDAWTWWHKARGRYERSDRPTVGSILVVSRTSKNRYGHLAVVTRIVNDREIIVNHANWLNKGRIHLDTPVRDVSPGNDWSAVRFWYTPANVLGKSTYPVSGFIHPRGRVARND